MIASIPDSRLTPGAMVFESRSAVCAGSNMKNKPVSASVQREVFEEYGIVGAEPRAYEVDYLATPALGGAEDIHEWNAQVKDALKDRLHGVVRDGSLDLAEAHEPRERHSK